MKMLRAYIFAFWPLFWMYPWVWNQSCLDAAHELSRRYMRRRGDPPT